MFHVLALSGTTTDLPVRMALALVMILLALIGGRVTPSFTEELLAAQGNAQQLAPFSRFDGASIVSSQSPPLPGLLSHTRQERGDLSSGRRRKSRPPVALAWLDDVA
jgi:hypothetical protein